MKRPMERRMKKAIFLSNKQLTLIEEWINGAKLGTEQVNILLSWINGDLGYTPNFDLPFPPFDPDDCLSYVDPCIFYQIGDDLFNK